MTRILCICLAFLLAPCALKGQDAEPAHQTESGFQNPFPGFDDPGFFKLAPWMAGRINTPFSHPTADVPRVYNDGSVLKENHPYTVTWIGQSTVLIQIEGTNILTDPVWASRIGPVRWAGEPRLSEPGIALDRLPPIDLVLISHNHYDHLDESTILELAKNPNTRFIVPLRNRDWFEDLGVSNVSELDWWEGISYKGLKIICAPAQHFSGRWLTDKNKTLWCSWIILGKERKLYFCGDSGMFPGFKEAGRTFGPFDLVLLPIGGYAPRDVFHSLYMNPEESLRAFKDLQGKKMLAIHWGTFRISDEPVDEPPERLRKAMADEGLDTSTVWIPRLGETREW